MLNVEFGDRLGHDGSEEAIRTEEDARSFRSNTEKVAILLASLESSLAVNLLQKFEPDDVRQILSSSKRLGALTSGDVEPVVDTFAGDFSEALGISAGPEHLTTLLESAFSSEQVARLLGRPVPGNKDSVWPKFTLGMEASLMPYLLDENEQTTAYIFSKLQPDMTARCLAMMPKGARGRVALRMLKLVEVAPEVDELLQETLQEDLLSKSRGVDVSVNRELLANVVNKLDKQPTDELLDELERQNPEVLKSLRKFLFQFEDIGRLDPKYRMKLLDRVPTEAVIPALFGTDPEFRELVLSSLGARARRMVESELQGDTAAPRKDTMSSRRKISDAAVQMMKKGEIELPSPESAPAAAAP
jgi:flagellar motor switch protein FliG